jgi:hypothetical protein
VAWDRNERRNLQRRQDDAGQGLGRDDLYLLLESYRNSIELNTTLLERQELINEGQGRILAQVVAICETQAKVLERLNGLPADLHTAIDALCGATAARCEGLGEQLREHAAETFKEHQGHRLRIYGAYVGMGTIILGLIGLLAKVWPVGGAP